MIKLRQIRKAYTVGKNKLEVKVYNYRWRAGFMFGDMLELKSKQKKS